MTANPTVGIRFNELDKASLRELARRLRMSQSDTLRALVRETLAILNERDANDQTKITTPIEPVITSKDRMVKDANITTRT